MGLAPGVQDTAFLWELKPFRNYARVFYIFATETIFFSMFKKWIKLLAFVLLFFPFFIASFILSISSEGCRKRKSERTYPCILIKILNCVT